MANIKTLLGQFAKFPAAKESLGLAPEDVIAAEETLFFGGREECLRVEFRAENARVFLINVYSDGSFRIASSATVLSMPVLAAYARAHEFIKTYNLKHFK